MIARLLYSLLFFGCGAATSVSALDAEAIELQNVEIVGKSIEEALVELAKLAHEVTPDEEEFSLIVSRVRYATTGEIPESTITYSAEKVSFLEAIRSVVSSAGWKFRIAGSRVFVTDSSACFGEELMWEVFHLDVEVLPNELLRDPTGFLEKVGIVFGQDAEARFSEETNLLSVRLGKSQVELVAALLRHYEEASKGSPPD